MPSSKPFPVVLADTNVLSELTRDVTNPGVVRWAGGHTRIAVSAVTIEEILYGFGLNPRPAIEARFEDILESFIEILPVTSAIARRAGALRSSHERVGRIRHQADMLIAATALMHGLTMVTRDVSHFEGCGLTLLNPFR